MKKIFYSDLIKIEEVFIELDNYELSVEERNEFITIIDETFHFRTFDIIMSRLPREHHEYFLTMMDKNPVDPGILTFLKNAVADIDKIIQDEAEKTKKEIIKEIKKSKVKK